MPARETTQMSTMKMLVGAAIVFGIGFTVGGSGMGSCPACPAKADADAPGLRSRVTPAPAAAAAVSSGVAMDAPPCVSASAIEEDPVKQRCEMDYWKAVSKREGTMDNRHYQQIYTSYFGLDTDFYAGKKFLDVGCGPRGSLEWAKMSVERVCVDPLARQYGLLGSSAHEMVYVHSGVEDMPFPDNSFDIIATINNLDHVTHAGFAMDELARVLRPGGTLLLIVEVHAVGTPCEPQTFEWTLTNQLVRRGFVVENEWHTETYPKCKTKGTQSVVDCPPFDEGDRKPRDGFIAARLRLQPAK